MHKSVKISLLILLVLIFLAYGVYWAFFDLQRLPEGDFLTEQISPDGTYTLKAYVVGGGATVDFSVRGELVWNETKKKKTIYWQYHEEKAVINWINNDTVEINGKKLKVPNEGYDFRRE